MSAIKNETHEQNNMEPADIVSVSMSPPSSDHNESTGLFTFLSAAAVCFAQCGNYGNSLSRIFGKNSMKVTVLLNKLLKS